MVATFLFRAKKFCCRARSKERPQRSMWDKLLLAIRILAALTVVLFGVLALTAFLMTRPNNIAVEPLFIDDSVTSAASQEDESIIIIGAGTAGLFAGYTLEYLATKRSTTYDYQILEAYSDFGGRVRETTDLLDVPIDLGAEWIHGDPKILQDLLLFENDTVPYESLTTSWSPRTYGVYKRGEQRRRNWIRFFYREFKFRSTTWYSYLRDMVVPYVESNVVYDTAVRDIDYSGDKTRVVTSDGREFLADKVVLTVPLAVMDKIRFTPALPESKRQAMDNVYVSGGLKVWIEFDEKFYPDMQLTSSLFRFLAGEVPFYFNAVFRKPSERHALAYFDVDRSRDELQDLDDEEIISAIMIELDKIFDGKASQHYVNHRVMNWAREPFIGGSYSIEWEDFDGTIGELQRPVGNKLFFAGEHTEPVEVATVHGAAMSGRRVAQQVLSGL